MQGDCYLDTLGGAVVVVGAFLPGGGEVASLRSVRLSTVFVVGKLDLVISTGQGADVLVASDRLASGFLETDAVDAGIGRDVGGYCKGRI